MVGFGSILNMVGISLKDEQLVAIQEIMPILMKHQNDILYFLEHIKEITNACIVISEYANNVKRLKT